MKIGVIGPTNLVKLGKLLRRSRKDLLAIADMVGKIVAESGHELWVGPDGGMPHLVGMAYKKYGGPKLIVVVPEEGSDPNFPGWSVDGLESYISKADEQVRVRDWYVSNHILVKSDIVLCVGRSAGTFIELGNLKFDIQDNLDTNAQMIVGISELLLGGELPPELALDLNPKLQYVHLERLPEVLESVQTHRKLVAV